jgi:RNA polymerase sigma-70 factor (ECF subfamily)
MPLVRRRSPPGTTTTADEELVVQAQGGDREAFAALYRHYLPRVHGYCYRLLGTREAAEDATTDIFMRALAALPSCRPQTFRSWLFAIAHNVIADERRRRPTDPLAAAAAVADPTPVEERATVAGDWSRVLDVLPHLSPDQQQVVALRLSGLSAAEIGEALGKPRNAVDGIHHRAVLRLRALLIGEALGKPRNAVDGIHMTDEALAPSTNGGG